MQISKFKIATNVISVILIFMKTSKFDNHNIEIQLKDLF